MDEQGPSQPKVDSAKPAKVSVDDLSNDDIATLHNILFSGITVSARIAKNVADLQEWTTDLVKERGIPQDK